MNKLMIRHAMDKPLPYDAEVEYIESTGTQYIDTGILATSTTSMECQFAFLDSQCPQFMCMGCTLGGSRGFFNVGVYYNVGKLGAYMSANAREGVEVAYDTQYHTYYLSAAEQRIDSTTASYTSGQHFGYNTNTGISEEPINIWLFARNISWQQPGTETLDVYSHMTCRLKYVRIMNNGILVRDYIPVRKGNTGYLYDKVSGRLFGNQGTGNFILGPDYNPFAYQYLTFVPLEDSTFSFAKRGTGNDIEYSIDGGVWTSLASEANTPTVAAGHNIRWRAELVPSTTSDSQGIGTFSATGLYDAMGNTMSLLYGDNYIGQTTLVGTSTFYHLWYQDTHIHRADRMVLPAKKLTKFCCHSMFYGCTSLVTAPELPATSLTAQCYYSMFYGCSSLTTTPSLPATTVASDCYALMFYGCTSLVTAPVLPATTLATECYLRMFQDCTNLVTAPELPATTLVTKCYYSMFQGCTSLTTAPELPATTLAYECYASMFRGCTGLITAPELPATTLAPRCYTGMFYGCTSLTTTPSLPATTLADNCYLGMFKGCTSLTTAPVLPATTLAPRCYQDMFRDCSSLNYIKALFTTEPSSSYTSNWVSGVAATGTFVKSTTATWTTTGVNGVPKGWTVEVPWEYEYLTFIPVVDTRFEWAQRAVSGHLEYSVNGGQTWVTIANGESTPTITAGSKVMWRGNLRPAYSITNVPTTAGIGTFSSTGNYKAYGNTMSLLFYDNFYGGKIQGDEFRCAFAALFYADTNIIIPPLLPSITVSTHCYRAMFQYCTSLTTAPALPATTLADYCYIVMFYGCKSLTQVPELPAATLVKHCYRQMFNGCSSLSYIKSLATDISATSCTVNWLSDVASTGTFVKAASMEDWPTGSGGIPSGWTVIDDPSTITT